MGQGVRYAIGPQGPPGPSGATGPKGESGSNSDYAEFHFPNPISSWPISHGLNKYPSVTLVDLAGIEVESDIAYNSPNTLTVTFASPQAGTAIIE